MLLPRTVASTAACFSPLNLYSALFASLLIHILTLFAISSTTPPLLHPVAGRLGVVLRLPNVRHQSIDERDSTVASPTISAPMPSPVASNSDLTESERSSPPTPFAAYYRRSELTIPAIALSEPDELPQPIDELSGLAELTLLVGEDGAVDAVITKESSFPPKYYEQLEIFFSQMKFQPGMLDGKPAKSRFEIEVSTTHRPVILESKIVVDTPLIPTPDLK